MRADLETGYIEPFLVGRADYKGTAIMNGDKYYEVNGETVHEDDIREYAEEDMEDIIYRMYGLPKDADRLIQEVEMGEEIILTGAQNNIDKVSRARSAGYKSGFEDGCRLGKKIGYKDALEEIWEKAKQTMGAAV